MGGRGDRGEGRGEGWVWEGEGVSEVGEGAEG